MTYPWYSVSAATENLQQGDFIKDLPIFLPKFSEGDDINVSVLILNVIILSQSCDLENKKIKTVMVCPFKPYSEFVKDNPYYGKSEAKQALVDATVISFHLLDKCEIENFACGFLIVDFRNTFSVPIEYLESHSKKYNKRLRLLPPYREQLAQNFARFFMRVGLPSNIRDFIKSPPEREDAEKTVAKQGGT